MTQKEKLRERKIYNTCGIADLGDNIFVSYARNGGRTVMPSWWAVHHTKKLFKNTAWYTQGAKTFICNKKSDIKPFMEALQFASKVTGCYEWIKTAFGGYVSKFTADKVGLKYKEKNIIKVVNEIKKK